MYRNIFSLLVIFILFSACRDEKSDASVKQVKGDTEALSFYDEGLLPKDFEACKGVKCPKIRVNYLKFREDREAALAMNRYNEKNLIQILDNTEEGSKTENIKGAVEEFIKDYQNFKNDFPNSAIGYEVEISQSVLSQTKDLLVLETDFYIFTGGAHGYGAKRFANFDIASGELLTKEDLFSNLDAFKNFAEKEFRKKYKIPEGGNINAKGFFFENDKFALPENIAVTKNRVILVYNRYEAASYAEGELNLSFPKNKVAQWLIY
ncbi:Protein of unknown function [Salegentibacter holothuriorum]|uniref:Deacetylase PdaC domain-containing protein n=1 Tax=Salegentibacter holothuriorum TaxID=241145 RepID=A0A1T5BRG3_9FLAO|nr:DUF3298 and DUF4163 domain-containing protein [Salegentibacter holothuriorum]SKB49765.1 Protein of unknown function [Salegentibacter holothuriorum]